MKLVIDIDDDSIGEAGSWDNVAGDGALVTVLCPARPTMKLEGTVDGWKHDGRTSKRLCASAKNARADR